MKTGAFFFRSFLAVDVPQTVTREIQVLTDSLKKAGADVKWVEPQNLHLTLKFLGDLDGERLSQVKDFLDQFCPAKAAFPIRFSELGGFPDLRAPKVLWVGLAEGEESLKTLAAGLESGLAEIGFEKSEKPFSAHLTIGRVRSPKGLGRLAEAVKVENYSSVQAVRVDHIIFYKSTLTREGPIYESIHTTPFLKEKR